MTAEMADNKAYDAVIAVVGSLLSEQFMITDKLPDLGESFAANSYSTALGGKGANAAMAAHRSCHRKPADGDVGAWHPSSTGIDIKIRMIGAVGADDYAARFRETLLENGIDISELRTFEGVPTGTCFCIVEEDSRENRLLYHPGATHSLTLDHFKTVSSLGQGQKPDLVISQLELKREVVEELVDMASREGIEILLNAAPANTVLTDKYEFITHLLINETEAAILSGRDVEEVNKGSWDKIAREFLWIGARHVVITLGAEGAYYATNDTAGHVPGFKVEAKDPTGAGDAFTGAYATEYVRQIKSLGTFDIHKAVVRACAAAALVVGSVGSQTSLPWADEIEAFASRGTEQKEQAQ